MAQLELRSYPTLKIVWGRPKMCQCVKFVVVLFIEEGGVNRVSWEQTSASSQLTDPNKVIKALSSILVISLLGWNQEWWAVINTATNVRFLSSWTIVSFPRWPLLCWVCSLQEVVLCGQRHVRTRRSFKWSNLLVQVIYVKSNTHVDILSYPGSDVPCIASWFKYL